MCTAMNDPEDLKGATWKKSVFKKRKQNSKPRTYQSVLIKYFKQEPVIRWIYLKGAETIFKYQQVSF